MANEQYPGGDESAMVASVIKDLDRERRDRKRALRLLLKEALDKENHFLALSTEMGDNRSYIASVNLKWFEDVFFASDQPVFEDYTNSEKAVKINSETLEQLSQRKPDWSRQIVMSTYLAVRKHHKFPPALLVAYQDWIFDGESDKWDVDRRALEDSIKHEDLDVHGRIVDLSHDHTNFYALDGQHRLMAVKGLRALFDYGRLKQKRKDGSDRSKAITVKDILQYDPDSKDEQDLKRKLADIRNEKIGVEIIPAVQRGETQREAFARLRQIFVDVNQNAKRLEKSELALFDEMNGFSIVARRVMVSHPLFCDGDELRVDTKSAQLSEKGEYYTTLQSIVNVAELYLGQLYSFRKWKYEVCDIKDTGFLRPAPEELEEGEKKLFAYFDAMQTLPSHDRMIQGTKISRIRVRGEDNGEDNILFRPITQEALAQAVGELEQDSNLSPEAVFRKLGEKDDPGESFLRLTDPASCFYGILCDPVEKKMRRQPGYRKLATRMFEYLLNRGEPDDVREQLREDVFESRCGSSFGTGEPRAENYDGRAVTRSEFKLPNPW